MNRLELAVLFAGGKSRRMGQDKALLEWAGKPLWRHQLEKLEALLPKRLVVAAPERPAWLPETAEWLADAPTSPIGPLGGLLAALELSPKGLVAALAVDLPSLPANYLESLLARCGPETGLVPQGPFGYEPLAAIYPATAAQIAREWVGTGRRDLQGLVAQLVEKGEVLAHPIPALERPFFRNLNTPADLAQAGPHP